MWRVFPRVFLGFERLGSGRDEYMLDGILLTAIYFIIPGHQGSDTEVPSYLRLVGFSGKSWRLVKWSLWTDKK